MIIILLPSSNNFLRYISIPYFGPRSWCLICEDDDPDDDLVCPYDLLEDEGSPVEGFPGHKQKGVSAFALSNH